jgi:hypothetical protein
VDEPLHHQILEPMNKLLAISLFILPINLCNAQNIVPNPSFENYSNTFCGIQAPGVFNQIMIDWVSPTAAAPQIFFTTIEDSCYNFQPFSLYGGPLGLKGNQIPRTGDVMVGVWSYTIPGTNQRHYVQTSLSNPMVVGNTYVVEFYVSLADFMELAIDKIGAHLSVNQISSGTDTQMAYTPQVESSAFIDDVTNWVLVSDTIIAQEAYSYITIGNFNDDNSTNTMVNPSGSGDIGTYGALYFIDDVRVEEIGVAELSKIENDQFQIYPTNVTDELNLKIKNDSWVEIHNSFGQVVFSEQFDNGQRKIDVSGFSTGIYIVSAKSKYGTISRKIVK